MDDFNEKFEDLINRGYEISFYENENFNLFTQKPEKVYYVSIQRAGLELFHFPSRISSSRAFINAYNLIPKVEKLFS